MVHLLPGAFFDLDRFAHRELFFEDRPVWETLGNIAPYLNSLELGKIHVDIPRGTALVRPELISIGEGTIVQSGAYIEGPCSIGRRCEVRQGAYIRPGLIAGDACILGHASEFKHAILLDCVRAAHFNFVGDSILGNGVNLGAGAICSNLRLDRRPVSIRLGEKVFETGLEKLGGIVGDHTQLGCNAVVNPGILLDKGTRCKPAISIRRSHVRR